MSPEICVCQACGNVYLVTDTRFYCPVCSGDPVALEGLVSPAEAETEEAPAEELPEETPSPQGEDALQEDPPVEKPKRRRKKK